MRTRTVQAWVSWSRLRRRAGDDRAGETLEYALIAGLIIIAVLAVLATVGSRAIGR